MLRNTQVFYVVDVSGPAVLVAGLPMCEDLKLITMNTPEANHPSRINTITFNIVDDLKAQDPSQFDTTGNFKHKATLHLVDLPLMLHESIQYILRQSSKRNWIR